MNDVRQNIEKLRVAKGITKTYVAGKLGLSLQGYRHIIAGTSLDVERLKVIAEVLGVKPAVFFDNKLTDSVIRSLQKPTGTG
ncbi:helix-turn-helix transcriptional regulator [Peptococcaceae bacterium 1198_IL3148]